MIPRTLFARLSLGLVVVLVVSAMLHAFISVTASRHHLEKLNQELNRNLARDLVSDRNLVQQGRLDEKALKDTFALYMTINPGIEIYLLDLDGTILNYSADPAKIKRKRVSLEPIQRFLRADAPVPVFGDDPRSHDRRKGFSVTPVPSAETPEGYLYVVLRGEEYDMAEHMIRGSPFLLISAWALPVSLGFGLLAGLVVFRLLTHRLQRLSGLMESFEAGDFGTPVRYVPSSAGMPDEIDRLGVTFDRMARRIGEQIEQMTEQDSLRRRLVAQVSHDLRTPLASIRGYLESLQMKGESLPADERAAFVEIALSECQRLNRQIDALFELASLEARESEPQLEPFALTELIHDVVRKHQPRADENGAVVDLDAPADAPFAFGDVGLTERVLDNLIDNAIDHTAAGGHVRISVSRHDEMIAVTVTDDGPGIATDDLPRIFEPFYRGGGETGDRSHAGLGLAIARRIMDLQHGEIRAESTPGQGATFRFRLPIHQVDVMKS